MGLISNYKLISVTHHNLELNEIANFYIKRLENTSLKDRIKALKNHFGFHEIIYLETCNRVSYIFYGEHQIDKDFLMAFFKAVNPELDEQVINNIQKYSTSLAGDAAIQHVFELASSMDSLVVGEREIFRQFRNAYAFSKDANLCNDKMRLLEKATVSTAKEVYHQTGIGEKALSIVSLAIQVMKEKNIAKDSKILLIGSGETNTLVAKFLKKYQLYNITIYNRSLNNAKHLSDLLNAPAYHISELEKIDGKFDVIFICTSANKLIIDLDVYKKMIGKDPKSKKLIIDLAVPRNVSEDIETYFNVDYVDIESLRVRSERNLLHRKKELEKARPITEKNIDEFRSLVNRRQIESSLSGIPKEIKLVKEKAKNSVFKNRIKELDQDAQLLLDDVLNYMEKKCISIPMRLAKENFKDGQHT